MSRPLFFFLPIITSLILSPRCLFFSSIWCHWVFPLSPGLRSATLKSVLGFFGYRRREICPFIPLTFLCFQATCMWLKTATFLSHRGGLKEDIMACPVLSFEILFWFWRSLSVMLMGEHWICTQNSIWHNGALGIYGMSGIKTRLATCKANKHLHSLLLLQPHTLWDVFIQFIYRPCIT